MGRYDDIDPQDIDPDTGRPYGNYSSPSLDTSFHDGEMDDDPPTEAERLREALRQWKCDACGGSGKYLNRWMDDKYWPPKPREELVECTRCKGSGLHPTAAAALGDAKPTGPTYTEDGDVLCSDPRGHAWVVSDENENYCYCERCGVAEY